MATQGSRRRARVIGTNAERLALAVQTLEVGAEFFETDTSNTYKVIVTAGALPGLLTHGWLLLGNTASPGSSWTTFAGVGPHTVTAAMGSVLVEPGPGVDALVDLPDLATIADTTEYTFVFVTSAGGTGSVGASVVLRPFAGQSVGDPTMTRFFQNGTVTLRANTAASSWAVVVGDLGMPDGVDVYVATTGSNSNPGTSAAPLLTIEEAQRRLGESRWTDYTGFGGYAHINVGAGTFTNVSQQETVPAGVGAGAEALAIIGTAADSGLGARTIAASTTGSGSTFGTVQDSVGGFVVNAYRDMWIRLTGAGAHVGKRFMIASNTANTFTVDGTFPAVTTETFVVEQPGTIIRYSSSSGSNSLRIYGANLVVINLRFDGQGGTASLFFRNSGTYFSTCQFLDHSIVVAMNSGNLYTLLSLKTFSPAVSVTPLATVGGSFASSVAGAVINTQGTPGVINIQNSNIRMRCQAGSGGVFFIFVSNTHAGDSGSITTGGSSLSSQNERYDTVTAIVGDTVVAAIAAEGGGALRITTVAVNGCTGAALGIANGSTARVTSLTGAGNAGVPVQILDRSGLYQSTTNSVTGAVAGQDVQVGGNAASSTWAAVNAGLVTDQAAAASQFCTAGP